MGSVPWLRRVVFVLFLCCFGFVLFGEAQHHLWGKDRLAMATRGYGLTADPNSRPNAAFLIPGSQPPPAAASLPYHLSRETHALALRGYPVEVRTGGAVGSWVINYRFRATQRREFQQGNAVTRVPWRGTYEYPHPGFPVYEVDPTSDNISALAKSVQESARHVIATNTDINPRRPYSVAVSFEIDEGNNMSVGLPLMTLQQFRSGPRFLELLQEGLARVTQSDSAAVLSNRMTMSVKAYPTDVGTARRRRGGCVGEVSEPVQAKKFWSPATDTDCLIHCLAFFVRKASGASTDSMKHFCRQPEMYVLQLMAELQREAAADTGAAAFDRASPDEVLPLFHAAGHKLRVLVHFEGAPEPTSYGDARWPPYHIRQLGAHFVVIRNPEVHYGRPRKNRKGALVESKRREERVVHVEGIGWATSNGSKPSERVCGACGRLEVVCKPVPHNRGLSSCARCGLFPRGEACAAMHVVSCDKPLSCSRCGLHFDSEVGKALHACETAKCKHCGDTTGTTHQCILAKQSAKPCPHGLVAYDLETRCRPDGIMEAACVCVSWVTFDPAYVVAMDEGGEVEGSCGTGAEVQRCSYVGKDCVAAFCEDLFVAKKWAYHTVAAHNGSKFDAHFLMERMVRGGLYKTLDITTDGTAIKFIRSRDGRPKKGEPKKPHSVLVIDSMATVPLALRAACKAFEVKTRKTFFSFTRLDKWVADGMDESYVCDNPAIDEYPEPKSAEDKADLAAFVAAREGKPFEFVKELVDYCATDCDAQLEVMIKYHDVFVRETAEIGGSGPRLSPWSFVTGAAATFGAWSILSYDPEACPLPTSPAPMTEQRRHMEADGIKWLALQARRRGREIDGMLYGHKVQVPGTKLRCLGRLDDEFFDMMYCNFSGCPHCYGDGTAADLVVASHKGMTQRQAREETEKKRELIESLGFAYTTSRSCEFARELKRTPGEELAEAMDAYHAVVRLNVRRCYAGGRVEPGALYYKCAEDEVLRSFDAVSLYPSVMVGEYEYPCGLPEILVGVRDEAAAAAFAECVASQDVSRYFGLIRCRVLVDRRRHHHPLVYRHHAGTQQEKLVASACAECGGRQPLRECGHAEQLLCEACAEGGTPCMHVRCCTECQAAHMARPCEHSDEERAFWLECTTAELEAALEAGDRLLDISEVHHFARRGKPTREYVGAWYRAKQRASGWPAHIAAMPPGPERDAAETAMLADLDAKALAAFGAPMNLRREEIAFNAGARQVAKINLNALYGKFGTRPERTAVAYVTDPDELGKVVDRKTTELRVGFICKNTDSGEPVTVMVYETAESNYQISQSTSVYVAIFVTAYGRLKLYREQLAPTGARALYWDTDSCLKVMKKTDPVPPCDDFLGEWGHEPEKDATAFASLGPKTYALDLVGGGVMAKCKGIGKAAAGSSMSVGLFKEILTGERACIFTRQEQWARTNAPVDGDCGYRIRVTRDFGRTTRLTAAKRAPLPPEFFEDGSLRAIRSAPFGHNTI
jgi:DNA polymerase type B, organellar and viral